MKLEDAQAAIELLVKYPKTPLGLYTIKALELLIEAGKRFNSFSGYPHSSLGGPLPGETEE